MRILQDVFDRQIQEQYSFHRVGARLIEKKLGELGVALAEHQIADLEAKLLDHQGDSITVSIDDDQLASLDPTSEEALRDVLCIDLSDAEHDIDALLERDAQRLSETLPELMEEVAQQILKQLKRDAPSMLKDRKKGRKSFETRLARAWGKPLGLLEMLLVIAQEAGDDFNHEFRPQASEDNDCVFEVLTRLHARSCQITSEVLVLLRAGHADGAHARWRTLHEIAVVGYFIETGGREIAERYLLHDVIESRRASMQYQEHCRALGCEPLSEQEMNAIELDYQNLLHRFGPAYKEAFGWAAPALDMARPTFRDIERKVGLDHLRPYYRMASHNVHANPKGVLFKLGLLSGQEILLAGPSNLGLTQPGHGTAISLGQTTTLLLCSRPNVDRVVICNVLLKLIDEIGEEFAAADESLKNTVAS